MTTDTIDLEDDDYSVSPSADLAGARVAAVVSKVPLALAGKRFDQALATMFPSHSRSRLAQLVKDGAARLNGVVVSVKTIVSGAEEVAIELRPRDDELAYHAEKLPLQVLFEDEQVVVIDKPAGLVVHPGAGNWSGTLLNGLLHRYPEAASVPRAGIVHRLDKDTSGVMVVARTEAAQVSLVRQLQARSVKREYLALVRGHPDASGTVDAPIGRHPRERVKMAVVAESRGGKPAVTHFAIEATFAAHSLLRCKLETGRTHQIRVHLQSIGFPIEGDLVYAPPPTKFEAKTRCLIESFGRQALHAQRLAFVHPRTERLCEYEAPLADDMACLIAEISRL